MKEVYFDTNIYTHLDKLVQAKDFNAYDKLRRAVLSDHLRIYTSFTVYEETNTAVIEYPRERLRRFQLIRRFAKRKKMIRFHARILENDVASYAKNERFKSPFMAPFARLGGLHRGGETTRLLDVAKRTKTDIKQFREKMRDAYSTHIMPLAAKVIADKEIPTFEENYRDNAPEFARMVARQAGFHQECEAKGLEGFLKVPSVNVLVGVQLSIVYANTYLGRLQNQGDSRDVQHVLMAAAVGTFVTEDANLVKVVKRMNSEHVKAIRLRELLEKLP